MYGIIPDNVKTYQRTDGLPHSGGWVVDRDDALLGELPENRRMCLMGRGPRTSRPADTGSRPVPEGTTMTDDELRIIAFLEASAAARPADLPDWMLALLEGDHPEEMSPELITAASLIYARRLHPGIGLDAARALMAEYGRRPGATRRPLRAVRGVPAGLHLRAAQARGATRGRLHRRPVRPRGGGVGEADRGSMAVRQPGVAPSGRPARAE